MEAGKWTASGLAQEGGMRRQGPSPSHEYGAFDVIPSTSEIQNTVYSINFVVVRQLIGVGGPRGRCACDVI